MQQIVHGLGPLINLFLPNLWSERIIIVLGWANKTTYYTQHQKWREMPKWIDPKGPVTRIKLSFAGREEERKGSQVCMVNDTNRAFSS